MSVDDDRSWQLLPTPILVLPTGIAYPLDDFTAVRAAQCSTYPFGENLALEHLPIQGRNACSVSPDVLRQLGSSWTQQNRNTVLPEPSASNSGSLPQQTFAENLEKEELVPTLSAYSQGSFDFGSLDHVGGSLEEQHLGFDQAENSQSAPVLAGASVDCIAPAWLSLNPIPQSTVPSSSPWGYLETLGSQSLQVTPDVSQGTSSVELGHAMNIYTIPEAKETLGSSSASLKPQQPLSEGSLATMLPNGHQLSILSKSQPYESQVTQVPQPCALKSYQKRADSLATVESSAFPSLSISESRPAPSPGPGQSLAFPNTSLEPDEMNEGDDDDGKPLPAPGTIPAPITAIGGSFPSPTGPGQPHGDQITAKNYKTTALVPTAPPARKRRRGRTFIRACSFCHGRRIACGGPRDDGLTPACYFESDIPEIEATASKKRKKKLGAGSSTVPPE
ncbi:hypothetical protein BDN72DRAFT_854811 [Pluteus cervinus]|uniref:Uncharacterized protein n=1 Tax=Pluteus cervinus TaxID=181527 RepID=A0ACD3B6C0_9AGAR|nr:hypothetical protein BDN72DRAFT_854811 [Pluteus cervinus]